MSRTSEIDLVQEKVSSDDRQKYFDRDNSSVQLEQLVAKASMALESTDNAKKKFSRIVNSVDKGHKRLADLVERENLRKGLVNTKLKTN